jgi:hypothetical protein
MFKRYSSIPCTCSLSLLLVLVLSLTLAFPVVAALINLKISGSLVTGGDVKSFEISADGKYAVFQANAQSNTVDELFSVPVAGGERILLSSPGSMVQGFAITPDSQFVVYWTVKDPDPDTEIRYCNGIFAAPITGGLVVNLGGSIPDYNELTQLSITSDSQFIVYKYKHIDPHEDAFEVLWAAPLDGSGPLPLTSEWCWACSIDFQIAPHLPVVVYIEMGPGRPNRMYRSTLEGVKQELAIDTYSFAFAPDGDWVVFTMVNTWPKMELYSIPIEGGAINKLSGAIVSGGMVLDFKFTPNSQNVVYRADELVDERVELFSVPVDGSTERVRLISPMIPEGDVMDYQITPNSLGVVYMADQIMDERFDLGSVSVNGGTNNWLNKDMVLGGDVTAFAITPNNFGVVFIADKYIDETFELFSVSIFGTLLSRLNAVLLPGGNVLDFKIAPNSQVVVYRADQVANDAYALFAVPSVGGVAPLRLNQALVPGGDVHDYAITPDSKGVLYLADQEMDGVDELFATFDRLPTFLPVAEK